MRDRKNEEEENSIVPEQNEATPQEIEVEEIEEQTDNAIASLKRRLREVEKEKTQHLEDLQRARADFLNSKRRIEEQLARDRERISDNFIIELLPLLDSFDLALANTDSLDLAGERWRKGIEAIYSQFASLLARNEVVEIECVGELFDPTFHEAVSNVEMSEDQNGRVVSIIQKGYRRGDRVLRPARVAVGV